MIGAFVAGAIGGALFASPEHVVNETHVYMPKIEELANRIS